MINYTSQRSLVT